MKKFFLLCFWIFMKGSASEVIAVEDVAFKSVLLLTTDFAEVKRFRSPRKGSEGYVMDAELDEIVMIMFRSGYLYHFTNITGKPNISETLLTSSIAYRSLEAFAFDATNDVAYVETDIGDAYSVSLKTYVPTLLPNIPNLVVRDSKLDRNQRVLYLLQSTVSGININRYFIDTDTFKPGPVLNFDISKFDANFTTGEYVGSYGKKLYKGNLNSGSMTPFYTAPQDILDIALGSNFVVLSTRSPDLIIKVDIVTGSEISNISILAENLAITSLSLGNTGATTRTTTVTTAFITSPLSATSTTTLSGVVSTTATPPTTVRTSLNASTNPIYPPENATVTLPPTYIPPSNSTATTTTRNSPTSSTTQLLECIQQALQPPLPPLPPLPPPLPPLPPPPPPPLAARLQYPSITHIQFQKGPQLLL